MQGKRNPKRIAFHEVVGGFHRAHHLEGNGDSPRPQGSVSSPPGGLGGPVKCALL